VFSAYFAIFARAVSTFKELTLRAVRKGYFERSYKLRTPPICCGTARAHAFAKAEIDIPSAHEVPAASPLTSSMNVSTPVLTTLVRRCIGSVSHSCGDVISA